MRLHMNAKRDPQAALTAVPTGMAARLLGCCSATLHNWRRRKLIGYQETSAGRYLWNVHEYLATVKRG
jgi:hypothetical protein